MIQLRYFLFASLTSLLLSTTAYADSAWADFESEDDDELFSEEDTFIGRIQFGYIAASGNSETRNLNGKAAFGWDLPVWRHAVTAAGIYSEDQDVTTAENYRAAYKADRKLGEKNYLFGALSWQQDEFSGYAERTTEAVGYGRRLLETDVHILDAEIGVGQRQTELVDGTEQDETIGRLAGNYVWQFGENSDFSQQLLVESGDLNTYIESVSALTSQLLGELDLVVSYTIKRNSDVPADLENVDTYTSVSLQYNF